MDKVFLRGDGKYAVPIVGESHHQEVLEELCGAQAGHKQVMASLTLENENPRDANAVRVDIDGKKVGYLSREMAVVYRGIMTSAGHAEAVGTCKAVVNSPDSQGAPPPRLLDRFYEGDIYEVFLDLFDDTIMDAILKELAKHEVQVTFDSVPRLEFPGARFCLTGSFSRPKDHFRAAIENRGGTVAENVSKKVRYLVVGSAGSTEWKYGTYGTKIEKAMLYKEEGCADLSLISEDQLVASLDQPP